MRSTTRTTVLALSLLALAACGDGDTTSSAGQTTPAADSQTSAPADEGQAAASEQSAVDIDDFRFKPETITVAAGTEVTWTNQDDTAHTVTAGSEDDPKPDEFDLEVDAQGDTVSTTFDEPGSYPYFCELHPFMEGTVEVDG